MTSVPLREVVRQLAQSSEWCDGHVGATTVHQQLQLSTDCARSTRRSSSPPNKMKGDESLNGAAAASRPLDDQRGGGPATACDRMEQAGGFEEQKEKTLSCSGTVTNREQPAEVDVHEHHLHRVLHIRTVDDEHDRRCASHSKSSCSSERWAGDVSSCTEGRSVDGTNLSSSKRTSWCTSSCDQLQDHGPAETAVPRLGGAESWRNIKSPPASMAARTAGAEASASARLEDVNYSPSNSSTGAEASFSSRDDDGIDVPPVQHDRVKQLILGSTKNKASDRKRTAPAPDLLRSGRGGRGAPASSSTSRAAAVSPPEQEGVVGAELDPDPQRFTSPAGSSDFCATLQQMRMSHELAALARNSRTHSTTYSTSTSQQEQNRYSFFNDMSARDSLSSSVDPSTNSLSRSQSSRSGASSLMSFAQQLNHGEQAVLGRAGGSFGNSGKRLASPGVKIQQDDRYRLVDERAQQHLHPPPKDRDEVQRVNSTMTNSMANSTTATTTSSAGQDQDGAGGDQDVVDKKASGLRGVLSAPVVPAAAPAVPTRQPPETVGAATGKTITNRSFSSSFEYGEGSSYYDGGAVSEQERIDNLFSPSDVEQQVEQAQAGRRRAVENPDHTDAQVFSSDSDNESVINVQRRLQAAGTWRTHTSSEFSTGEDRSSNVGSYGSSSNGRGTRGRDF
ncbi:unnamed protein product [Amoebophrya sp. A120]|nr:unnamed protein product [Amoebophrya sp. A120]|eukprot:GSA120T00017674001.1